MIDDLKKKSLHFGVINKIDTFNLWRKSLGNLTIIASTYNNKSIYSLVHSHTFDSLL